MTNFYNILVVVKSTDLIQMMKSACYPLPVNLYTSPTVDMIRDSDHPKRYDLMILSSRNTYDYKIRSLPSAEKIIAVGDDLTISKEEDLYSSGFNDVWHMPFSQRILTQKISNSLRLDHTSNSYVLRKSIAILYINERILKIGNSTVYLNARESFLLKLLFESEHYLKAEKIIDQTEAVGIHNSNHLAVSISRLRGKIRQSTGFKLIRCMKSRGYYLTL